GNSYPVWTSDGRRVVFRTRTGMSWIDAEGGGRLGTISGSASVGDIPSSVSPDGDTLLFGRQPGGASSDIYALSLRSEPAPHPVGNTPAFEGGSTFSPDGRLIAYASDESGQMEVYLRPFPGPDRKWPVSTQGGTSPCWNRNGKEIFYRKGNAIMAVEVR